MQYLFRSVATFHMTYCYIVTRSSTWLRSSVSSVDTQEASTRDVFRDEGIGDFAAAAGVWLSKTTAFFRYSAETKFHVPKFSVWYGYNNSIIVLVSYRIVYVLSSSPCDSEKPLERVAVSPHYHGWLRRLGMSVWCGCFFRLLGCLRPGCFNLLRSTD